MSFLFIFYNDLIIFPHICWKILILFSMYSSSKLILKPKYSNDSGSKFEIYLCKHRVIKRSTNIIIIRVIDKVLMNKSSLNPYMVSRFTEMQNITKSWLWFENTIFSGENCVLAVKLNLQVWTCRIVIWVAGKLITLACTCT